MKKVAFFCIPAHGHTNKLTEQEEAGLKNISTTEMTLQDIRITLRMDSFLDKEFKTFKPDVIYSDSVCFWGKLNAWKHHVPLVVSTSTFAFNQLSSQYMKNTPKELADMILGLPRVSKELKTLEPYGYHVKGALSLVQSDNQTDSIVYTSRRFQPYAESFSDHYAFVGPSVFSKAVPDKTKECPLVYISMGTVINDRRDFYTKCIEALRDQNVNVVISCGNAVMNSVSESLYMAAPMVLYPQTSEQKAVARRVMEIGAGTALNDDSIDGIRASVHEILSNAAYGKAAEVCSTDFRSCTGAAGAAEFIENAPHSSNGLDVVGELNKTTVRFHFIYWATIIAAINLIGFLFSWKYVWIIGVAAGILSNPIGKAIQKRKYFSMLRRIQQ